MKCGEDEDLRFPFGCCFNYWQGLAGHRLIKRYFLVKVKVLVTHSFFSSGFWFIFSMSRYVPVSTKMDSEDHYHSPYDTNDLDSDVSFSPRNFMKYHICVFLFAYVFVFVHKKNNFILKMQAHYEAPSCLKRNPSGSLFIPSGKQQQLYHYLKNHFLSSKKSL